MPASAFMLSLHGPIHTDKPTARLSRGNWVIRVGLKLSLIDNIRDHLSNERRHAI